MIKFGRIAVAAAAIAGAFTFADAFARDAAPVPSPTGMTEAAPASPAQPAMRGTMAEPSTEPCARKVKVVYGGHGEAARAACPVTGG